MTLDYHFGSARLEFGNIFFMPWIKDNVFHVFEDFPSCYHEPIKILVSSIIIFNSFHPENLHEICSPEQAKDITDLGSLKEAAKIFVPGISSPLSHKERERQKRKSQKLCKN